MVAPSESRKVREYAAVIGIVVKFKMLDPATQEQIKKDPEAWTELSNALGDLEDAHLMHVVERLVAKRKDKVEPPVEITAAKPAPKGYQPKKITPPLLFVRDPERGTANVTNNTNRRKAINSDIGHQFTLYRQQRRAEEGLPPKRLNFKEMLTPFTNAEVFFLAEQLNVSEEQIRKTPLNTPKFEKLRLILTQNKTSK